MRKQSFGLRRATFCFEEQCGRQRGQLCRGKRIGVRRDAKAERNKVIDGRTDSRIIRCIKWLRDEKLVPRGISFEPSEPESPQADLFG